MTLKLSSYFVEEENVDIWQGIWKGACDGLVKFNFLTWVVVTRMFTYNSSSIIENNKVEI